MRKSRSVKLTKVHGVIRRRLLVNFRIDADVAQAQLPKPFRPKLHDGYAVAGVCLIRLEEIRPRFLPRILGLSSENAAHRFAVKWTDDAGEREGVYIPRRDLDYAIVVGLRMLTLRHLVLDSDGLFSAVPSQTAVLRYYANSIAHLLPARAEAELVSA